MKTIVLFLLSFVLLSCSTQAPTEIKKDIETTGTFAILKYPDIGGEKTLFKFNIKSIKPEDSLLLNNIKVSWDFNADGKFDTGLLDSSSYSHQFSNTGRNFIRAKVEYGNNEFEICSTHVWAQPLTNLYTGDTSYVMMEPAWNNTENKIAFAWHGYPHQIYEMNSDGTNIECLTCNLPIANESCRHNPCYSPDGKKIAYFYNDGISYFDLENRAETRVIDSLRGDVLDWSLDGNYIIMSDDYNDETGIHLIDAKTGQDSIIIQRGYSARRTPNENIIGFCVHRVLPVSSGNSSKITYKFYDLDKKIIIDELDLNSSNYLQIFQIVKGRKYIYNQADQNKNTIYSLADGKEYTIDFTELGKFTYGTSITADGSKIILAINRGLWTVTLPESLD